AIGSQTAGSVIRPASFCGVVGFKPTYDAIALGGVLKLAPALDTLGTFARTVADAGLLAAALGKAGGPLAGIAAGAAQPERVVLCRTHEWDQADEATREVLDSVLARLAGAGVAVDRHDMPRAFDELVEAQNDVMVAEMAASLAEERANHAALLSEGLRAQLDKGAALGPKRLAERLSYLASCRAQADSLFDDADLLLTAAAPGPAPPAETTGDPLFNRPWTALHLPCLTLPAGTGAGGLPIGAQLVGRNGGDARLVAHGAWIESVLGE
ncbi:MAG TPA: amidase family protein, partial [Alphaproteobacteria bacterium]